MVANFKNKINGRKNMTLIKCPECGKEISDKAKKCPHCGIKCKNENEIKTRNEFDKIKKSNNYSIVVVISNVCPYSEIFKPILEDVVQEYNVNIYYLNIDSNFYNSVDLDTSVYGTPTTIIYKNDKVINNIRGYKEKNDLINILKKNGVIK